MSFYLLSFTDVVTSLSTKNNFFSPKLYTMAKILTTAIVADIRNKLNGSVFSKNRYGSYVRTKVTPVNPRTTQQQNFRNRLATNSQAWRGLTEEQRQAWNAAAVNFPVTDIFGNIKLLSGNALFVRLNNNLLNIGQPTIATPPDPAEIPALALTLLVAKSGTPELKVTTVPGTIPTGFKMLVRATPNIAPGRSFVKNQFRNLTSIAAATAGPHDILSAYAARFGNPQEGQKIFLQCYFVNMATGQAGIPVQIETIVVPA